MKKILFLVLTISLVGCSKDENETIQPNYTSFLNNHTPSLKGLLNSQFIDWKYESGGYQMSTGFANGNGVCSTTDPFRILMFGLSNDDASNQFTITTPKMDTSNQNDVKNVLSLGDKLFSELYNKFQFRILINNSLYINNPNSNQKLQILKTEEFTNYDNTKHMFVWIKIDDLELENINQSSKKIQLKNGLMIAELYGYIFE
jgi:hypothetical protein